MTSAMTSLADRTIAALRANHDELAELVSGLSLAQLTGPSGATEWTVADVLSHLGSGSEIMLATYRVALEGADEPADDFNQGVWDRWNALDPQAQADGFVEHDAALVERLEAIPPAERESVRIKLGFLPTPLPLGSIAGMRLNEAVLHGWDVRVGIEEKAGLGQDEALLLAEQFAGGIGFLLGFTAKPGTLTQPAVVALGDSGYSLTIGETVALTSGAGAPTATLTGPFESAIRLLSGRLSERYTPADVEASGDVTLDDLRAVFPGY